MWNEIITLIYLEPNEMLTIVLFKSSFTHWKSNTLSVITKILLMEAKYCISISYIFLGRKCQKILHKYS